MDQPIDAPSDVDQQDGRHEKVKRRKKLGVIFEILRVIHLGPPEGPYACRGRIISKSHSHGDARDGRPACPALSLTESLVIYSRTCPLTKQFLLGDSAGIRKPATHRAAKRSQILLWPLTRPSKTVPASAR